MNSIVLKAISRSRGSLILPLRSTLALRKTQYQTIVSPKPVRQLIILGQTLHIRNFTTTPPLAKKKGSSKGSKPAKPPSRKDNKGPQNAAAAPRKWGREKGVKDFTADWNKGETPSASKWCRRMDMITARTISQEYEQIEKAVYEWAELLEEGIQAGIPAAHINATVRQNRQRSPGLREWVTDPGDDVRLWPSDLPLEESDEVDIEKKWKEWDEIPTSRKLEMEEEEDEVLFDENDYEKFRRETIGPKYDTMTEEERDKAMEELNLAWEELDIGRQLFGPKWDTMSKEERISALQELEDSGVGMFGPEWDTMSEVEKDKMMSEYMGLEEGAENDDDYVLGDDDELEEFDPEDEEFDLEDDEDLEAELGGERDDWKPEEFENSEREELEHQGEKPELGGVEEKPEKKKGL
ncbi:uncharacterized protein H6S33_008521 [Morchella sextelata]|uniref:uncharacterized protein n=1 Tax=Morchella sextelata TaxID=1174677 RepID=UPI001D045722|nr:uncharacterized protein H6S33_008521 [Morchella sextelata]KAH0602871.1 hypothetical protein H6S33_008521 [Morchella sextelata]